MSVVFILVFVAIIMAVAFLIAFIWAVKSGQYEDTYTPSVRILFDDLVKVEEKEKIIVTEDTLIKKKNHIDLSQKKGKVINSH